MRIMTIEIMRKTSSNELSEMETRSYLMRRSKAELAAIIDYNELSISKNLSKETIVNKIMAIVKEVR